MSISTGAISNRAVLLDMFGKAAAETAIAHPSLLCITGPLICCRFGSLIPSLIGWLLGGSSEQTRRKLRVSTSSSHFTVCCSLDRRRTLGGAHEASRSQVCPTSPGSLNREAGHSAGKDFIERDGCWKLIAVPMWPVRPWENDPFFSFFSFFFFFFSFFFFPKTSIGQQNHNPCPSRHFEGKLVRGSRDGVLLPPVWRPGGELKASMLRSQLWITLKISPSPF